MAHPRIAERAREPRYTLPEAAAFIRRPVTTVRRWSIGNVRKYSGVERRDEPLITPDGPRTLPLSFLNLLELRFLASYRDQVPLQSIRRALDYAAAELGEERPLLSVDFQSHGKSLFIKFASEGSDPFFMVDASRKGQLAWPQALNEFIHSVDYAESSAHRWWPLGRGQPVMIDTRVNGGRPSTSPALVRTTAIAAHSFDGLATEAIAYDVGASEEEVRAALRFEKQLAA